MITKKQIGFITLGVIVVPILINGIMMFSTLITIGDYVYWIPFWGNIVGALIAGGITLYVLLKTIEQNRNENKKALLLNYKKEELFALKQYLVETNNVISQASVVDVLILVNDKKYIEVGVRSTALKLKMGQQLSNLVLIYRKKLDTPIGKKYRQSLFQMQKDIVHLLSDIVFINDLRTFINIDKYSLSDVFEIINKHYELMLGEGKDPNNCKINNILEFRDENKFLKIKSFDQFDVEVISKSLDLILTDLTLLYKKGNEVFANATAFIQEQESEIEELINS